MTTNRPPILFALTLLAMVFAPVVALADAPDLSAVPALTRVHGDGPAAHDPSAGIESDALRIYWFWSAQSTCSQRAEPEITALMEAHPDIPVVVVHSNATETAADARQTAAARDLPFSVYRDEGAHLAIALNAHMTPEVVVLTADGVLYQGRTSATRRGQTTHFAMEAIDAYRAGEPVSPAFRRPTGCRIARP
jgi:hypothetical protein